MRELAVKLIPHEQQRYNTAGDYFTDQNGVEQFRVSLPVDLQDAGDFAEKYAHLVMIHEIVERVLTYHAGVSNEAIDAFDIEWTKRNDDGEPGDEPTAPYYRMHQIASIVERIVAAELGVNWQDYELSLNEL
jgi:hypothetical protein